MPDQFVSQLKESVGINASKKILLYNPENEDFMVKFLGIPQLLPAHEIKEFEFVVGNHVKKHLITFITNRRKQGLNGNIEDIAKEVDVTDGKN